MNRRAKITVLCFGMVCLFLVSLAGTARTYGETRVSVKEELVTLLALPADKIDLTETLLLISRHWDPKLDAGSLKGTLDRLEESARRQLKDHPSPKETVEILRRVIHQEGGYRYTEQLDPQGIPLNPAELFLHGLLQTRRGYCMNLSLLYLILGERLNLPLYGVPLPNHFFVRYESAEYRVNIEATEGGAAFPDSFYQQRFGVAPGSKYFMTGLNKKQTLGAYFSNVGLVLYRAARPQDAIFYLEQSAEINPQSIDALNNLGNIYSDLQQRDKSINAYERALKADPRNFSTLFNLGLAYSQARNYKKGEEALLQAAQINPGFSRTHEILARIYMAQGKNAGALLHFKILNRLQPGNLITQLNIGTLLMVMGQPDMALKIFLKMQRRHPESLEVNARIAELHYQLKEYPKAVVQYEYIIGRAPKSLQNYIQLGWVHYKMNRLDRAIEVTRRGLETATMPNRLSPLAQMNLGYFHVLSRKFEEAEQWYQKVLNTEDPGNTQAM
ncbi:MAG: tetratricopeptide repeat protein, partial [Nitrospinaceae bacterium]|nr:tetratricopeptide repeat protein [Nitrospinaceae bacterium]NIR57006.1 tetratricopeptide repeat protein [Nitrospinaceae bacterium]NIS87463.1 tetratricopeptide repeat protein [Nitrospinaceae bacterium]NIT84312.1 tetratricopeptide repeat protein [Nitrospinaceae bacterium]NIU46502.1 tetratricopeptide repeat protein [Nitrospinaceae bacterium]